jgi:hypothetical protein
VFDSEYFRTALQADVDALGGSALVSVHLIGGRTHRLRAVVGVHAGYVTAEAFQARGDVAVREPRWGEPAPAGGATHPTERAVIAYESIADVTITAARPEGAGGIGFGRA